MLTRVKCQTVGIFSSTLNVVMKFDGKVNDDQKCTVKQPVIIYVGLSFNSGRPDMGQSRAR